MKNYTKESFKEKLKIYFFIQSNFPNYENFQNLQNNTNRARFSIFRYLQVS